MKGSSSEARWLSIVSESPEGLGREKNGGGKVGKKATSPL